jgi:hypothetical protein
MSGGYPFCSPPFGGMLIYLNSHLHRPNLSLDSIPRRACAGLYPSLKAFRQ